MLPLPDAPVNPLKLADWLELYAFLSPDGNSSQGDLERALRRAALFNQREVDAIEQISMEVFDELEQREKAAEAAYPFRRVDYSVLQVKSGWEDSPIYTFCLCLSYFGWTPHKSGNINPRILFEQISCLAAKRYIQGESVGFGPPRTELPASFSDAVTEICRRIGEGGSYREQPPFRRQDDKLDLIAWKEFTDRLPSKILMFGQCASGWNWEDKLTELRPEAFWGNWMQDSPVSPLIRLFFVPHRIERHRWNWAARNAGIIFDRCRIAFWAHGIEETDYSPYLKWSESLLGQITNEVVQ